MKYFTPQLWIGFNTRRKSKMALKTFDHRLKAYRKQLGKIVLGLRPRARKFFQDALLLHDGTLARMEIGDWVVSAPKRRCYFDLNSREAAVRIHVLPDRDAPAYVLAYNRVSKVELNFPGKLELFPIGRYANFGDWGYDELTSPRAGVFRHEILFASGATIAVEFGEFSVRRTPFAGYVKRATRE
jgi:hypothetical protein